MFFIRKHLFEINELLHDAYLNMNEDNLNITIQNEQLLEKFQDACFTSNVSDCQMVDCLEDSHDMEDHEKCGNLNVLDVFEYEIEDIQTLDVVEEELELSLDEGYVGHPICKLIIANIQSVQYKFSTQGSILFQR